jgi:putative ABC transport system substrate-binding protein
MQAYGTSGRPGRPSVLERRIRAVDVLHRRAFVQQLAGLGASAVGLVLISGCSLVLPSGAQPSRVPHVGFVGDAPDEPWVKALWDGLRELGWVEGQTITIEHRSQVGKRQNEVSALIAELVALPADLLVTVSTATTLTAKQATNAIPIVFISVADPVGVGLVASLAHPGGNLTGVSPGGSTQLDAKELELLKDVIPGLQRVAVISQPVEGSQGALALARLQEAAGVLGVQLQALDVGSADDLAAAFAAATRWPADGVIVRANLVPERARVAALAERSHLPAIYGYSEFVDAGGLMSYGTRTTTTHRHAATYVDKILRGGKPADLPVEQLTTVEFAVNVAVNVKAAQILGLTIPPDVAAQVTDWVA